MKHVPMAALTLVLLAGSISGLSAVGKVTADPNKPAAGTAREDAPRISEPSMENDPVLAVKVTCEASGSRLHRVVAQLSAASGVAIRCGTGSQDWQVRDLPVTICVSDLPLGTVLRALTDCTHTSVATGKAGGRKFYRITRDTKLDKALADWEAAKDAMRRKSAQEQWAMAVRLKDIPESKFAAQTGWYAASYRDLADFSRLISLLPPQVHSQAMAGQSYRLWVKDASEPIKKLIAAILAMDHRVADADHRAQTERRERHDRGEVIIDNSGGFAVFPPQPAPVPPTAQDVEDAALQVCGYVPGQHGISVYVYRKKDNRWHTISRHTDNMARLTRIAESGFRDRDLISYPPQPDSISPDVYEGLSGSKLDALSKEIRLRMPDRREDVTAGNALVAAAKSAGINLVFEDYASHHANWNPPRFFGAKTTRDLLEDINDSPKWHVDSRNGLVIGHADDWRRFHKDLVRDGVVQGLIAKLESRPLDLDDLAPVAGLTEGQRQQWLLDTGCSVAAYAIPNSPMWRLYSELSPQQKAAARSEQGLPLLSVDQKLVLTALQESVRESSSVEKWAHYQWPPGQTQESTEQQLSADPRDMAAMVLRVTVETNEPTDERDITLLQAGTIPRGYYTYRLEISTSGGIVRIPASCRAPVYSEKLLLELTSPTTKSGPTGTDSLPRGTWEGEESPFSLS